MDHQELLTSLRKDLYEVKDEIVEKLDSYQHRVTKLETHQSWIKRTLIGVVALAVSIGGYYIKKDLTEDQKQEKTENAR